MTETNRAELIAELLLIADDEDKALRPRPVNGPTIAPILKEAAALLKSDASGAAVLGETVEQAFRNLETALQGWLVADNIAIIRSALRASEAKVERWRETAADEAHAQSSASERARKAEAANARLRGALRPFAKIAPSTIHPDDGSENESYGVYLTERSSERDFGGIDLAVAREVLSSTDPANQEARHE